MQVLNREIRCKNVVKIRLCKCSVHWCYWQRIWVVRVYCRVILLAKISGWTSLKSWNHFLPEFKGTVMQIKKSTDKWLLMCFKSILKISHSNYASFCTNLPIKFVIFWKSYLLFSSFYCFFVYKQKFMAK